MNYRTVPSARVRFPLLGLAFLALTALLPAQAPFAWGMLDLEHPGLKAVAEAVAQGDEAAADAALLAHFRNRPAATNAWGKARTRTPSSVERRVAEAALAHRFYVHDSQQGRWLHYGEDIDWTLWPVRSNELRFQLHRHKWFMPLLRVWAATGDARYFEAWRDQWADWRRKNPWPVAEKSQRENARFAWRPLEVSHRLNVLPGQLALAVHAPGFAAADLKVALADVVRHGREVWVRRSAKGNHLLFEMQRLLAAAQAFPELKASAQWQADAVHTLQGELRKQVYPDGVQYELDLGYHLSAYRLFRDAIAMAPKAFAADDRAWVGRMAAFADDLFFPDGGHPYFADTHTLAPRHRLVEEAKTLFPDAFERPAFVSRAYPHGGFYVLREGTPETGSMVVLKAGPPAYWHNQPDNGTFSYWRRGRDFFPDAGSYVYGGPDTQVDRDAFRATAAHTTLTLDGRNLGPDPKASRKEVPADPRFAEGTHGAASRLLRWEAGAEGTTVAVETDAYPGLTHHRTLTLAPGGTLTVEDEALGPATGRVEIRFCLAPGADPVRLPCGAWRTRFPDGNDILLRPVGDGWEAEVGQGWRSRDVGQKEPRPILCFRKEKTCAEPVRLRTEIIPAHCPETTKDAP